MGKNLAFVSIKRAACLTAAALCLAFVAGKAAAADTPGVLQTAHPRCEYLVDPLGVGETSPRFSWTLASDGKNVMQSAYQVVVASTEKGLDQPDLWDTGKVTSDESAQIEYKGKPLTSREQCFWRVRAWDGAGIPGPWSEPARWEMGLLQPDDWQGKWIAGDSRVAAKDIVILKAVYVTTDGKVSKDVTDVVKGKMSDGTLDMAVENDLFGGDLAYGKVKQLVITYTSGGSKFDAIFKENAQATLPIKPLSVLRKQFKISSPVTRARLYATAMGIYDFQINGKNVGDHILAPDWTDYKKRVRYQVYDVTPLLTTGDNAIAGMVADGWFSGHIGNGGYRYWGSKPSVMAQLEITHADGQVERIITDESWQSHASPILSSDFMLGENYDARLELPKGPSAPDLADDQSWTPAMVMPVTAPELDPQVSEPVRELMTIKSKVISEPATGQYVFDLGQNMVGLARIKVTAPAGTKVTLRVAEMLNPDKSIYTTNYRGAPSIDTYICKGGGPEVWQPRFTFHGMRYVELLGLPTRPGLDAVTGVVIGSNNPQTGQFTCSDPRINQLQSNIQWGQRGNFVSVPTDCPQRDERLGWMGDAQVFIGTAVYNADVSAFFSKWLVDVDDAQKPDGRFTNVSPDNGAGEGTPAWADAGVICPWTIYHTYGDTRELKRHLPAMTKWVEFCREHSEGLIREHDRGSNFGDWLAIKSKTPSGILGTAYFAHVTDLLARSYRAVGDDENATKYEKLFDDIKTAFNAKYVKPDGSMVSGTQTSYDMALYFGLLPENARSPAADLLAENVTKMDNHLTTGFVGVSYLLPALANNGHQDSAYRLLMQDTFPSWLFSVKHGATTIWERWDGWTPEKGFQDPGMNSFNHYSLGSCGQWMYEGIAGISQVPDGTSFKRILVAPHLGGGLTSASAHYDSIRGTIASGWKLQGGKLTLTVTIPPNTTATVRLPTADASAVLLDGQPAKPSTEIIKHLAAADPGVATYELGSGTYVFVTPVK